MLTIFVEYSTQKYITNCPIKILSTINHQSVSIKYFNTIAFYSFFSETSILSVDNIKKPIGIHFHNYNMLVWRRKTYLQTFSNSQKKIVYAHGGIFNEGKMLNFLQYTKSGRRAAAYNYYFPNIPLTDVYAAPPSPCLADRPQTDGRNFRVGSDSVTDCRKW